jgi:hypothetical protein
MKPQSKNLFKGYISAIVSISMFFIIGVVVVMSPDPDGKINYNLVSSILGALVVLFGYGLYKIEGVFKFLLILEKEEDDALLDEHEN